MLKYQICNDPQKNGFIKRANTNEHYLYNSTRMIWIDAEPHCQKFEAHLPSISTQSDIDYLIGLFVFLFLNSKNKTSSFKLLQGNRFG
jgi:hypothetical protein